MLTRLQAIQDIRLGRGIQLPFMGVHVFNGRKHTFRIILRRKLSSNRMCVEAVIDCDMMRRNYYITLTARQVMAYIKRNYPRHDVRIQSDPLKGKQAA